MITLLSLLGYLGVAFVLSRPVYGRLRSHSIDSAVREFPDLYCHSRYDSKHHLRREYYGFKEEYWNLSSRPLVITITVLICLVWPAAGLYPIGYGAYRYMTGSKVRSDTEIEAEREEMAEKIRKLEKELEIK